MEIAELKKMIDDATEERLREIVNDWIDNNDEFRKFVEHELNPPLDEIDFDTQLARAMMHETRQCVARRGPDILDWDNIYQSMSSKSLREMIPDDDWKEFYTKLLSSETGCLVLDKIAPFLLIEHEYEWLYRLLKEHEEKDKANYRTPLKYSASLLSDYNNEMRAMMVRTFRYYAEDRFGYKKKVKSGKYSYFFQDLHKLADIGMTEELCELVTYFKEEYKTRPSLMAELRKIKLK